MIWTEKTSSFFLTPWIGRADAPRVHAVAVCTARAIETHPAADGVRVPFERVPCRRVLGGEKAAADHAQHRDREHRARQSHTRFLLQWRVYTPSGGAALGKISTRKPRTIGTGIACPGVPIRSQFAKYRCSQIR